MASRPQSRNILSFFRPASTHKHQKADASPDAPPPNAASSTSSSTPIAKPPTPTPQPATPPRPSSLPATPVKLARPPDAVVADSDQASDDASDDDSDVEALDVLLGLTTKPSPSPRLNRAVYDTPKTKRTALEFHSSPVPRRPKRARGMFDLDALAHAARIDDAVAESAAQAQVAAEAGARGDQHPVRHDDAYDSDERTTRRIVAAAAARADTADQHRLARAMNREQRIQHRYCFFTTHPPPPAPSHPPATRGPWRMLTAGTPRAREQHLLSGFPQTLVRRVPLPDELLLWMLEQITAEGPQIARAEYLRILLLSDEHLPRLVTPPLIDDIFLRLGAAPCPPSDASHLPTCKPLQDPYADREWSRLHAVLALFAGTEHSQSFSSASARHAAGILLRLSLDPVISDHADLLTKFEEAMARLLTDISHADWTSFCFESCAMLLSRMPHVAIRINALLCLPISSPRALDLRCRLAIGLLFSNPDLARLGASASAVTLKNLVARASAADFTVTRQTRFAELEARIVLLDMVVNDGTFGPIRDDPAGEDAFNDAVDVLADTLKETWGNITDAGLEIDRTHTKTTIEWVRQRLMHTVRTRKRPLRDIYALAGVGPERDAFNAPKQREYMSNFLRSHGAPKA